MGKQLSCFDSFLFTIVLVLNVIHFFLLLRSTWQRCGGIKGWLILNWLKLDNVVRFFYTVLQCI